MLLPMDGGIKEKGEERDLEKEEEKWEVDRLYVHLRDNMEKIKEFCSPMLRQIPIPEQCVIEGTIHMHIHTLTHTLDTHMHSHTLTHTDTHSHKHTFTHAHTRILL